MASKLLKTLPNPVREFQRTLESIKLAAPQQARLKPNVLAFAGAFRTAHQRPPTFREVRDYAWAAEARMFGTSIASRVNGESHRLAHDWFIADCFGCGFLGEFRLPKLTWIPIADITLLSSSAPTAMQTHYTIRSLPYANVSRSRSRSSRNDLGKYCCRKQ
jgi:hypothetical protein